YRRWFLLTLLVVALTPLLDTASIWLYKFLVDRVLVPRTLAPFPWIAAGYLGLNAAEGLVVFVGEYLSARVGEHFLLDMRTEFFRHLQSLSLDFFESNQLGDIVTRLTSDMSS